MNNKVLKKIIGLTDKVKTMADKKTIIKLKTLKESANRDFTEADLAQREVGFNEKDNILYFRRSDGTIVKVETPTPEQLQLQYNGSEIAQYDGNINTTANFIINSENIPLSETDSTTVSEELEKKLEADVLELYVSLESYNKFNDIMFGSIDWEQSYENGFIPQLIVNVEQSFFDDLGNPENIDGKPYNPTSNNYKIGSTYLCIGGFDSTLTFKYDLWTAGNLPNESGYIINSIASAMSLLDDKFPNYYKKSEVDSKLAEKLDTSVASTTYATQTTVNGHISDTDNPHNVTKEQLGLGNVDNTSDLNNPVSTATQTRLDLKANSADVYNKSEVDSKLSAKLDTSVASSTYATKEELNNKVSSVYKYKGSVATEIELPQEGNVVGDVYNVESDGSNYAWDGEKWDKLGGDVDLTAYLTKEEANTTYATKSEIPTKLPNPEALTVTVNKEAFVTYDGSAAVTQDLVMNAETIPLNADTTLTVAYGLEEVTPLVAQVPIRSLQDKVYDQETILSWFSQESVADLKQKIVRNAPVFVKYGIQLSGNPHFYKFPVEYCAFESANQIKMVFQGLNTKDDVVSKYEIIINLDGTVIEGNSNVKMTITSLENKADKATTLAGYGITDAYTKSEVDSKLDTKQNTLSTEQLNSVNSGITAEHVATYDSYATEISSVEQLAQKADTAAEVAQQTANLIGSEVAQINTSLSSKADKATTLEGYGIGDAYTKTETYTQSEVDSKLAEKLDTSVASTTYATKDELNTLEENIPSNEAIELVNNNSFTTLGDIINQNMVNKTSGMFYINSSTLSGLSDLPSDFTGGSFANISVILNTISNTMSIDMISLEATPKKWIGTVSKTSDTNTSCTWVRMCDQSEVERIINLMMV